MSPSFEHQLPLWERPEIHSRRWFLLGIMCLSLVMVVMAVSGLNVAIPSIQRSLDATATDLQWIVDAYAIIFAGLLLSAGAIGDRFGRKLALPPTPSAAGSLPANSEVCSATGSACCCRRNSRQT